MASVPKLLSKTKLLRGFQCLKSIYLTIHHKELEPPITPELQALFDQGNEVGLEARRRFPDGFLVDHKPWDFIGSLRTTRELLRGGETKTIFEASFEHQGCYSRADIIKFNDHSARWTIIEVKSTTKLKDEHINDVGLQAWIMAKSGLPIEQINVMYLNPACRYPHLENLFITEDVTDRVRLVYPEIAPQLGKIFNTLRLESTPDIDVGPHCFIPNECPFWDHCSGERNIVAPSVFNLPKINTQKWDFYKAGILKLNDPRLIEQMSQLTITQQRMIEVFESKKRIVDAVKIQHELESWKFPLVFLDFETINPAIPRYEQTGPYQQVPFQFSVHIWEKPEDPQLHHYEYLHTDSTDPRPNLIPALLKACGTEGSIVSYYSQFESARIEEMADYSPEHKEALMSLLGRIKDPLPVIREHVYDEQFNGSFSIKSVGPALLGKTFSYEGLEVADGGAAQRAFNEIIHPQTEMSRKNNLIKASLEYCKQDTLSMVELVRWMFNQSKD